ncbi:alanine racemase [Weissella uvarum]|uniref:alanine racemase n=1 Tax=Weissella uvarum TaxID=1479233 RepID=UPI001960F802|nr:alanine racemase [Weissella uvarum]MBM7617660.1 alanine racemase [Weissella uvarum]MCM0596009.1 alanine racemase [Weissella uvarum]
MLNGIGTDIQTISAVMKTAERTPRFIDTVLTPNERAIYDQRKGKHQGEFLAGRFSAKEAFSKALGTGIGSKAGFLDIEILSDQQGAPVITKMPELGAVKTHISISHSGDYVHSLVILEQDMSKEQEPQMLDRQPIASHRPAWLEVSKSALLHNIDYIKDLTQTERFCAVVKANAYGHGLEQVVPILQAAHVDYFAVATMDEGIWLRQFGVTEPVMILGMTPAKYADELVENDLVAVAGSLTWLKAALAAKTSSKILKVSVPVDTGMGRIGLRTRDELTELITFINQQADVHFDSIWTHFATADTTNQAYFDQQVTKWHELTDQQNIPEHTLRHLANSGTSLWHELPSHDMIRVGAGMYGLDSSQGQLARRQLQPVMRLKAELVYVKQVPAGSSISYGATYTAKRDEWIGTLPIGYADGYSRDMQGMQALLPDGRTVELIGRIAMDQCMVRLPEEMPVGTEITLLGQAGDATITLEDLADQADTIPYEIATSMAQRLPRRVVE